MNKCGKCGKFNCKLYRPYGEFFRPERVKCKNCVPEEYKGWYVPLVCDVDGSVWGYGSVPAEAVRRWDQFPD